MANTVTLASTAYVNAQLNLKVNTSSIVDNVETDDAAKVLSAKQGKYLMEQIAAMAGGIHFKGTVGVGGNVTWDTIPTPSKDKLGWEYKVITDHPSNPECKAGDYVIVAETSTNTYGWVVDKTVDDAYELNKYKVTTLSESSTDTQYPSAKAVYDAINDAADSATSALALKLSITEAANTYLTKSDAASTYQPKGDYLTEDDLADYAKTEDLEDYLTETAAASTYETQTAAASTYATKTELADYAKSADVESTYVAKTSVKELVTDSGSATDVASTKAVASLGASILASVGNSYVAKTAMDAAVPSQSSGTDDKVPTTKAVATLADNLREELLAASALETSISESDSKVPSSKAVKTELAGKANDANYLIVMVTDEDGNDTPYNMVLSSVTE